MMLSAGRVAGASRPPTPSLAQRGGGGGGGGGGGDRSAPRTPAGSGAEQQQPQQPQPQPQPPPPPAPKPRKTVRSLDEVRRRNASLRAAIGMVMDSGAPAAAPVVAPPPPPPPSAAPAAAPAVVAAAVPPRPPAPPAAPPRPPKQQTPPARPPAAQPTRRKAPPTTALLDIVCVSTSDVAAPTGAEDLASALAARGHRVAVVAPSWRQRGEAIPANDAAGVPWVLVSAQEGGWAKALEKGAAAAAAAAVATAPSNNNNSSSSSSSSRNSKRRPGAAILALDWRAAELLGRMHTTSTTQPCTVALLDGAGGPSPDALAAAAAVLAPSPSHAAELLASPAFRRAAAGQQLPPVVRGVIGGLGLPRALSRAWDPSRDPFLASDQGGSDGGGGGGGFDPRTEEGLGWGGRAAYHEAFRHEVGLRLLPDQLEAVVMAGAAAAAAAADGDGDCDEAAAAAGSRQTLGPEEDDDPFALSPELLMLGEPEADARGLDDGGDEGEEVRADALSARAPVLLACPCRLSARSGQGGPAAEVLVAAIPGLVARGAQVVVVALLEGVVVGSGDPDADEPAAASAWADAQVAASMGLPLPPQSPAPPRHSAAARLLDLARREFPDDVRVLFATEGGRNAAGLLHRAFAGADAALILPPPHPSGDSEGPGAAAASSSSSSSSSSPSSPAPLRPEFALPPRGGGGTGAARGQALFARLAMRYGALPIVFGGGDCGDGGSARGGFSGGAAAEDAGVDDYSAFAGDGECGDGFVYGDGAGQEVERGEAGLGDEEAEEEEVEEEEEGEDDEDEDEAAAGGGAGVSPLSGYAEASSGSGSGSSGSEGGNGCRRPPRSATRARDAAVVSAAARELVSRAALACRVLRRRPRRWRAMQARAAEAAGAANGGGDSGLLAPHDQRSWARCAAGCEALIVTAADADAATRV